MIRDSSEAAKKQGKEGRSKRPIPVELDASRIKKNDPTLPTWDTLVIKLESFRGICVATGIRWEDPW